MFDLTTQQGRADLAAQIVKDIDAASVEIYSEERRSHLGASEIGLPCSRELYYKFRWCWRDNYVNARGEDHHGRMLRLFNQGHREEERFITYLRRVGFRVWEYSELLWYHPESDSYVTMPVGTDETQIDQSLVDVSETNWHVERALERGVKRKQFRMSSAKGHHGGSNDARCIAPERYGIGSQIILGEFKTVSLKHFVNLKKAQSVAAYFPKYYAQMNEYGYKAEIRYGVFLANNKNDNEIYCEVLPLNLAQGQSLEVKAHEIVFARVPPPRISENPADQKCVYCFAREGCHYGKPVEVNCRSCQHSEPVDNGEWFCHLYKQNIPKHVIPTACAQHLGITS